MRKKILVGGVFKDENHYWYSYFGKTGTSARCGTKEQAEKGLQAKLEQAREQYQNNKWYLIFRRRDLTI